MTKLEREWQRKLAESGFRDIESPGGMLSQRGCPELTAMSKLDTDGFVAWGEHTADVSSHLNALAARRIHWRTKAEREAWRLHTERHPAKTIATMTGLAVGHVERVIRIGTDKADNPDKPCKSGRRAIRAMVRALDLEALVRVAAALAIGGQKT